MPRQVSAIQRDLDRYMRIPGVISDSALVEMYRKYKVDNGLLQSSQAPPSTTSNEPSLLKQSLVSEDWSMKPMSQQQSGDPQDSHSGVLVRERSLQINRDIFKHIFDCKFVLLGANTEEHAELVLCAFMVVPRQHYELSIKEYIQQFVQGGRVFVGIGLTVQNSRISLKDLCVVANYTTNVGIIVAVNETDMKIASLLTLTKEGSQQLREKKSREGVQCFMENSNYFTRESSTALQKLTVQPNFATKKMEIKTKATSSDKTGCGHNVEAFDYKFPPGFWLRLSLDPANQVWGFLLLPDSQNNISKYISISSFNKVPGLLEDYKGKNVLFISRYARNCAQLLPLLWKANINKVCLTCKRNYIHFFAVTSETLTDIIDPKTLGQSEFKCLRRLATYEKLNSLQWERPELAAEKILDKQ